ncbi:MAG: autotransporter-associated beta strand repeat-containing protein [Kiritimatiellae bacterium]|nr:autotransporter-associated beta strand repeat-containing protein [Kiritimatiellia bacterium]
MKNTALNSFLVFSLATATLWANSTTKYWDNNGISGGFGTAGGSWGGEAKWSSDSTGAATPEFTDTTTDDTLYFGTESDGLATGTITVEGSAQAFKSMSFGAASGEITLTNGVLNLAAPTSTITINNTSNTINTVLAGTGGLEVYREVAKLTYNSFLTEVPVTIFTNTVLADHAVVGGLMDGASITDGPIPAIAFYFSNNGSTATYQLQAQQHEYIKCIKIELSQSGADITAKVIYAKYISGGSLGYDFDLGGNPFNIAASPTADGYGAAATELISTSNRACTLTLTGENTYSGNTTISNTTLRIGGGGQLGSGTYNGDIINLGTLFYNSGANQTLSGNISGLGSLVMQSGYKTTVDLVYPNFLTASSTTVFPNTELAGCVGADGILGGYSITGGSTSGEVFFFNNNGTTATWQLQTTNNHPHTKCVKVQLTQSGANITGKVLYAKYLDSVSMLGYNFDTGGLDNSIATAYTTGGYGAAETTISIDSHSTLTLSGTNSYLGGTVINAGRVQAISTANALPAVGGITVNNGGELVFNVTGMSAGNAGGVGNGSPITVNAGGMLTLAQGFNAGRERPITINGGTLSSTFLEAGRGANYINNLRLQNGAQVVGYEIRVGYFSAASIIVSGTNACSIPAGINMVKTTENRPLTFAVADVTGDSSADLTIPGVIRDYDENLANMPAIKTGAGTLSLSGVNTHQGTFTIKEGTLALVATTRSTSTTILC